MRVRWCLGSFEYVEIGRILLSLAVTLRNDWDVAPWRVAHRLDPEGKAVEPVVGTLIPNLKRRNRQPLRLRESFNKIIHATTLNLDRSRGRTLVSGNLRPRVHLYGLRQDNEWKASIDVFAWAEAIHTAF